MESKFKIMDTTQINGKVFQLGNSQIEEKLISMNENFRYVLKQNGALMSKGFVMGMQFEGLFENGNYKRYCKDAVDKADLIRKALKDKGIELEVVSYDTQTFAIFTEEQYKELEKYFDFGGATIKNGKAYARICTSWATPYENVNALVEAVKRL